MCEALQCMCRYRTANTYKFVTGQKTINISANYTKQNWQVTGLQVCVVLYMRANPIVELTTFQASKKQCLCFLYRYFVQQRSFQAESHIAEKVNCTGHFGHVGLCQLINSTFYQLMRAYSWGKSTRRPLSADKIYQLTKAYTAITSCAICFIWYVRTELEFNTTLLVTVSSNKWTLLYFVQC